MRWTELSSHNHRQRGGGWLPVVGDTVCVHVDADDRYTYLAQVIRGNNSYGDWMRYYVRPLFAPHMDARDVYASNLEPTLLTFQGYRCVRCKKGNIR